MGLKERQDLHVLAGSIIFLGGIIGNVNIKNMVLNLYNQAVSSDGEEQKAGPQKNRSRGQIKIAFGQSQTQQTVPTSTHFMKHQ